MIKNRPGLAPDGRRKIEPSPMVRFFIRRVIYIFVAIVAATVVLYGIVAMTPAETRAQLYMPPWDSPVGTGELLQTIIKEQGLDDPFPVQYVRWASRLLQGDWGWSPIMREHVLPAMLRRTPATVELTLYSLLLFIPLGLTSGAIAGWKRRRLPDRGFQLIAFIATSIPPFVLALVLLAIFYVALPWFPPGRNGMAARSIVSSSSFRTFTGLVTIDGLLNGRFDVTLDGLRHLVLPVVTLSLSHWATLGRVTRTAMIEELSKDYVNTARGKGLSMQEAVWVHALRNAFIPGINSSAVSAASLVTGVFVVEIIFAYPGVSKVIGLAPLNNVTYAGAAVPDMAATMGFALYSILVVLPLMFLLDVLQALIDPRIREGVTE
jgi:peptide/nickel transport system permease protein